MVNIKSKEQLLEEVRKQVKLRLIAIEKQGDKIIPATELAKAVGNYVHDRDITADSLSESLLIADALHLLLGNNRHV